MSDQYLDVFSADRAITALAGRVQPEVDDTVIRALGDWVESIDAAVPDRVPDFASVPRIDPGRRGLRITALVTAGVLALMSTGVAFAVGDHPFAPIERVVRHVVRPAKVQPLGAPPADESSAVGAQPSGSGSASGLVRRGGGTAPGGMVTGHRAPSGRGGSATAPPTPPTDAISTTILEITTTFLPLPTLGPSITMTIMTLQSPTTAGPPSTGPWTSWSPSTQAPTTPPSTGPTPSIPPSTDPTPSVPPSTDPTPSAPPSTDPTPSAPPSTDPTPTVPPTTDPPSTTPSSTPPSSSPPSSSPPSSSAQSSSAPSTSAPSTISSSTDASSPAP